MSYVAFKTDLHSCSVLICNLLLEFQCAGRPKNKAKGSKGQHGKNNKKNDKKNRGPAESKVEDDLGTLSDYELGELSLAAAHYHR